MPRRQRLRGEEGRPLPLETLTSPPLRQRRRKTPLGRARPPHGRGALRAKRQPVLHSRLRSMSRRRQWVLRHGSRTQWRPVASRRHCQSGSGGPSTPQGPNQGDFASLSEVAAALPSVPLGGLEAAAMEVDPEPSPAHGSCKTPPANPASPECSPAGHHPDGSANAEVVATTPQIAQPSFPQAGPGPQASSAAAAQDPAQVATPPRVLSPTSPAEPAKEGGGATTPSVEGGIPPATAPAVPVPEGEPRLLRLDVSCQVGTHLVVLRMALTANSTISSLIAKARERASAPGLTVASLHGSPDVELPHAATLGAVLPQGELRLLLREGPSGAAPTGASPVQGAAPSLFSPDQCWCYCCGIGTGSPLLMQAHAMTDRHVWNARVFVRRHRAGEPGN